ncbi:MAG: O-antigen ligase family protein [Candidatus Sericytochromatia bacterium]
MAGIIGHYLIYIIFFVLLLLIIKDKKDLFYISNALVYSSLILSIIGILSFFDFIEGFKFFYIPLYGGDYLINLDVGNYTNKASSFSMNPNNLGAFLLLSIFTILGLKNKKKDIIVFISLFFQIICLILTKSRGSIVSLFVGFLFFIFLSNLKKEKIIYFALLFLITLFLFYSQTYSQLLNTIFDFEYSSNSLRIKTWYISLDIIKTFPQGVGILNYESIYPYYLYAKDRYIPHAHNWYLHTYIESGVLLASLFFIFYFRVIIKFLNTLNSENYGLPIALISFSIFNITDYVLTDTRICMLLTFTIFSGYFLLKNKEFK